MGIPATAKRKVIKSPWWEGKEPRTVYLDAQESYGNNRKFDVYAEDGTRLGFIESYESSITTKIPGTRLVSRGKRRTFWSVNGRDTWKHLPSQAEAIRELLDAAA